MTSVAYHLASSREHCQHQQQAITIADLIHTFSITSSVHPSTGGDRVSIYDIDDIDDAIETQWTNGFLTGPKPFPDAIEIRSEVRREGVERVGGEVGRDGGMDERMYE